jgi:hypothetical protein
MERPSKRAKISISISIDDGHAFLKSELGINAFRTWKQHKQKTSLDILPMDVLVAHIRPLLNVKQISNTFTTSKIYRHLKPTHKEKFTNLVLKELKHRFCGVTRGGVVFRYPPFTCYSFHTRWECKNGVKEACGIEFLLKKDHYNSYESCGGVKTVHLRRACKINGIKRHSVMTREEMILILMKL